MSEPEIARRCPTCGASLREVARFCPQCGNAQPDARTRAAAAPPETTSRGTVPLEGTEVEAPQKSMSDTIAVERPEETPRVPANARSMSDTIAIKRPEETPKTSVSPNVRGAVGAKLQRVTTLARDVESDVIHRVQKVRAISSVVLDEAGDDPGLRFVLVAGILFVLFLVIMLLNRLIG
ncbi:MAG: zinc-ribbon domain-containing protein [Pyrinomonadaceae bacterium]